MFATIACWVNALWSVFLLLGTGFVLMGGPVTTQEIVLAVAVPAYCVVAGFAVGKHIWATIVTIVATTMVAVVTGSMVLINVTMFVFDHPLYQDSPGTILVVGLIAIVFTAPATLILGLFAFHGIVHLLTRRIERRPEV